MKPDDKDDLVQVLTVNAYDVDVLNGVLRDTDTEYQLLDAGHFHGQANRIELLNCRVEGGYANLRLSVRGKMPADKVTLGYILSSREPGYLNTQRVTQHNLIIFPEDCHFEHIEPPYMRWSLLQISRETLINRSFPLSLEHFAIHSGISNEGIALQKLLLQLFDHGPNKTESHQDKKILEDKIISGFIRVAETFAGLAAPGQRIEKLERMNVLKKIDEYLSENCTRTIRIEELVTLTGIQQRSLEHLFQKYLGMSPRRYITVMRMNRAYSDLRMESKENISVNQVMQRYGFIHAGRFAKEYKKMFGESPSMTLNDRHSGLHIAT